MAWDASRRRADPQPLSVKRQIFDMPKLYLNHLFKSSSREDVKTDTSSMLSPIEEERVALNQAPLEVNITVKFFDPAIRSVHNRSHYSSQSFVPTDRIRRAFLRRIEHCSQEFITRKDSDALNPTQCHRRGPKPLRFEIRFRIIRKGDPGAWADRTFRSYQKQSLTSGSAKDVLRSVHSIIGLFLRRHDDEFLWVDEPSRHTFPDKPETFKPSLAGPLDLACIPPYLFVESAQICDFLSGYALELTFKSKNPTRPRTEIRRTVKVDSNQTVPLNLSLGEDLLWQAHNCVQDVLDSRKHAFDMEHASCEGFDGVPDCDCQHFDEVALDVELRIINNLGPVYEHLHRTLQSRLRLFKHPDGQDCDDFLQTVQARLRQLRDWTDEELEMLNDFDFRIAELKGHGWHLKDPARFTIDGKQRHTRQTIEALLDRIRTGVVDVLRGHDVAIRMIAYKRGHLVLDKSLIANKHRQTPNPFTLASRAPEDDEEMLVAQLKVRIQKDIDLVCKDTCSLDDIPEETEKKENGRRERERKRERKESGRLEKIRPGVSPEAERASRPRTPPSQPSPPCSLVSKSPCQTPRPGSPARFDENPPIPPGIPPRSSSMRVFPLVHTNHQEEEGRPSIATTSPRHSETSMDLDNDYRVLDAAVNGESSASLKAPSSAATSPRDSETSMDLENDYRVLDAAANGESSASLKAPPITHEANREKVSSGNESRSLSPPAEVIPRSSTADDDSSSASTCSSMPALTESETPSPEQSILITPTCIRISSPPPAFTHNPGVETPSPSRTAHPGLEHVMEPKSIMSELILSSGAPPRTPSGTDADNSVALGTPKASEYLSGIKTASLRVGDVMLQASARKCTPQKTQVQEISESSVPRASYSDNEVTGSQDDVTLVEDITGNETDNSDLHNTSDPDLETRNLDVPEAEPSDVAQELPSEGWLLHSVEVVDDQDEDEAPHEGQQEAEMAEMAVSVIECDSSETSKPQTPRPSEDYVARQESRGELEDPQDHLGAYHADASVLCKPTSQGEALPPPIEAPEDDPKSCSVPNPEPERACLVDSDRLDVGALPTEDELSRSKVDFFEGDDEEAVDLESLNHTRPAEELTPVETGERSAEEAEVSERGHSISFSDSAVAIRPGSEANEASWPEPEVKDIALGPVDEADSEIALDVTGSVLIGDDGVAEQEAASGPLDTEDVRAEAEAGPDLSNSSLTGSTGSTGQFKSSNEPSDTLAAEPAPEATSELANSSEPALSTAPRHKSSRSVSSPSYLGLGSNRLLPPLPIVSTLSTSINRSDASLSCSSEWEDCASEARQSSDSVDTTRPSPSASEEEEEDDDDDDVLPQRPGSPKRLGTPTAGLLGLHESRWADFGIRGALTGTHAFDRPVTAPSPENPSSESHAHSQTDSHAHAHVQSHGRVHDSGLRDELQDGDKMPHARPSPPRKSLHLRHKRSISSVIFLGAPARSSRPHNNKDNSKQQPKMREKAKAANSTDKKGKSIKPATTAMAETAAYADEEEEEELVDGEGEGEEADGGANSRLSRTMMLFAGFALASSVVNRNSG